MCSTHAASSCCVILVATEAKLTRPDFTAGLLVWLLAEACLRIKRYAMKRKHRFFCAGDT